MKTDSVRSIVGRCVFALLVATFFSVPASAIDLTLFGGIQHAGDLTFESVTSGTSSLVRNFSPKTFGVFGARIGHGFHGVFGGEHTIAYAPNFISSTSHAWIYHSNLRAQVPIEVVKPYATGGIGLIDSSGNSVTSFGTEFAFNYGGGLNFMIGPVGANFDVRGYTVPSIHVAGFELQNNLNFVQVSAGLVIVLK